MIIQLLAYAAAVAVLRAGSPGSRIGQGTGTCRPMNPGAFAGAMRFHTGGIIGLVPGELPIIARKGEEVLAASDPRHRNNVGTGSANDAARGDVTVVNSFNPDQVAELMRRSRAGTKVLLNLVRDNQAAFKAALG